MEWGSRRRTRPPQVTTVSISAAHFCWPSSSCRRGVAGSAPTRTRVPGHSAGHCPRALLWSSVNSSWQPHCFPLMWGLSLHASQCGTRIAAPHAFFPPHPNSRYCRNGQDHLPYIWGLSNSGHGSCPSPGGVIALPRAPSPLWLRGCAAGVQDVSLLFFPPAL